MHHSHHNGRRFTLADLRKNIVGINTQVPLLDGSEQPYIFLDNAASTPTFQRVLTCVEEFLPWYSGVHRGSGFKSAIATEMFERSHDIVGNFVGADLNSNMVIFTKNTTECVNKLANRFNFHRNDIVITTMMEHHSNLLPWRKHATVLHVGVTEDGHMDLVVLAKMLADYKSRIKLVAVNGASNITGICSPIHDIAEMAHAIGAKIFVDAAQLAPHRQIAMLPDDDPRHIDFLALSAHKIYAPFGTGALIGPTAFFAQGEPDMVGGGVVDVVTLDGVVWNDSRHKEEAGSPNVVGSVALAAAIGILKEVGLENIVAHEQHLLGYAYQKLKRIEDMMFYGPTENLSEKVGVIPFNLAGLHHGLIAAILSAEYGIGVRNGYFCAQPYVKKLLNVTSEEDLNSGCGTSSGDKSRTPGLVRASFGCYSSEADVDALVDALERVARKEFSGKYTQDPKSGTFHANGYTIDYEKYFSFLPVSGPLREREHSESA